MAFNASRFRHAEAVSSSGVQVTPWIVPPVLQSGIFKVSCGFFEILNATLG